MNYKEFPPCPELNTIIDCFWVLDVSATIKPSKQRIVPDGLIEMAFLLGDDIKRYVTDNDFILQPRAFLLGQTTKAFYIEPTGMVSTFAARLYPHSLAHFSKTPLKKLVNTETPISDFFECTESQNLEQEITQATDIKSRIQIIESFFIKKLSSELVLDNVVENLLNTLLLANGSSPLKEELNNNSALKRKVERKFEKFIGITPKKLAKVIRFQHALQILLKGDNRNFSEIAHECKYFDQAHFIKDFREFTGISPKEFFKDESILLSSLFYKKD